MTWRAVHAKGQAMTWRANLLGPAPGLLANLDQSVALNEPVCPHTEFRVRHLEWIDTVPDLKGRVGDGSCAPVADDTAADVANRVGPRFLHVSS